MKLELADYFIIAKVGSGTFSEVFRIKKKIDETYWACKLLKKKISSQEQVNRLREVQCLRRLSPHPNILHLEEVIHVSETNQVVLICELLSENLYEHMKSLKKVRPFEQKIKTIMWQVFKALNHMHKHGIFHRDVKPENILVKGDVVKLADFGSCRGIFTKQPYTEYISTRWYRSPECLITDGLYSFKMDVWAAGCVFFEVSTLKPLFPGSNEIDQINKIHEVIGTPSQLLLQKFKKSRHISFEFPKCSGIDIGLMVPDLSYNAVDFLKKTLLYDPDERISAKEALRHPFFNSERQREKADQPTKKAKVLENNNKELSDTSDAESEIRSRKNSFNSLSRPRKNSTTNISTVVRYRAGSFGKKLSAESTPQSGAATPLASGGQKTLSLPSIIDHSARFSPQRSTLSKGARKSKEAEVSYPLHTIEETNQAARPAAAVAAAANDKYNNNKSGRTIQETNRIKNNNKNVENRPRVEQVGSNEGEAESILSYRSNDSTQLTSVVPKIPRISHSYLHQTDMSTTYHDMKQIIEKSIAAKTHYNSHKHQSSHKLLGTTKKLNKKEANRPGGGAGGSDGGGSNLLNLNIPLHSYNKPAPGNSLKIQKLFLSRPKYSYTHASQLVKD